MTNRESGRALWWILGIIGGVIVLFIGLGVWGMFWGLGKLEEMVADELRSNPVVVQHVGEIQEVEFEMMKTGQRQEKTGEEDVLVFTVKGSKAVGTAAVKTGDNAEIISGVLTVDGKDYPITGSGPPAKIPAPVPGGG